MAVVETGQGPAWVMKNCILPLRLLYDVDHDFWARVDEATGTVRLGLWVVAYEPAEPVEWLGGEAAQVAYSERLKRTFRSVQGVNDDFWCVHCNDWDEL